MTQSQIAEEIGVSQMHVSRLLARTLEQLRDLARRARPRRLGDRRRPLRRVAPVGGGRPAPDAAGWSSPPARPARPRAARPPPGSSAAPEAPGDAELDQLGQHDRARAPTSAAGSAARRRPAARAPYATKNTAVVIAIVARAGRPGCAARSTASSSDQDQPLDGHQRGGHRAAAPGRRSGRGSGSCDGGARPA